jgi:hypothetical protein
MQELRCRCGKIVCELDNMELGPRLSTAVPDPKAPAVVIMCRHCKNKVVIQVPAVLAVSGGAAAARSVLQLNTR